MQRFTLMYGMGGIQIVTQPFKIANFLVTKLKIDEEHENDHRCELDDV